MEHIHLPPAFLPIQWALFWWSIVLALLLIALVVAKAHDGNSAASDRRRACRSFLRSLPDQHSVAPGGSQNLTPLIGTSAGQSIGLLVIFIVKLLSAAVGRLVGRSERTRS